MGRGQSRIKLSEKEMVAEERELTPVERWNRSDHSQQDLSLLLESVYNWSQCDGAVSACLRGISSREKYQTYVSIMLQYLKGACAERACRETERRELFTYYSQRLAHSFFVVEDFKEGAINSALRPKEKLLVLYEYYSFSEELFEQAIFFNYPSIFTEFEEFVSQIIEREVIIKNTRHFLRFVIDHKKMQMMREQCEVMGRLLVRGQYERAMEELRQVSDLKNVFLSGVAKFTECDNGEMGGLLMRQLLRKGYTLSEQDYQFYLKVQLFSMFLYSLGKLSSSFRDFQSKSVGEIIHMFYGCQNVDDTPLLRRCFDIFQNAEERWRICVMEYCFSPQAHLSLLIRLLDHKYVQFKGLSSQFSELLRKVVGSGCEVGRYSQYLVKLVEIFEIDNETRSKFVRLVKIVECLHVFGLSMKIEQVYPLVYRDHTQGEGLVAYQESGLTLFKMLIAAFFKESDIVGKSVTIEGMKFTFVNLYDLLAFLRFAKGYIVHDYITDTAIHQLLFRQLITHEYYQQMSVLLGEQNMATYGIHFETVEMLIIDHLIELITTKRVRSIEGTVGLLMGMINIQLKKEPSHYIASYYRYFRYLQDNDISLPLEMKGHITIKHLYYIADTYPDKLNQLDFNYLFAQQSCIRENYTDTGVVFVVVITDEFLKFKIYLSNKCFSLKKSKLGNEIIQEIMLYEPPWLSAQLVKILRENPTVDQNFICVAFSHCMRGEDLQLMLSLHGKKETNGGRLSLKNIKKLGEMMRQEKYVCLDNDIVINEREYANLVAEMTFSKEEFRMEHGVFFRLLTTEPQRAFNYMVNYCKEVTFVINFMMEGVKREVIHKTNILPLLVRYLYFKLQRQSRNHLYIRYKEYVNTLVKDIVGSVERWSEMPSTNAEILKHFTKMLKNFEVSLAVSANFLDCYVNDNKRFKFLYDEGERKNLIMQIRQQPMSKANAKILRQLCRKISVDIVELSLYELFGRVNSRQIIDDEAWNIVQKLIFWGDERETALKIIGKLSQKVESLDLLVKIYEYLRESQPAYRELIRDEHLEIISSLAAVEEANNFYGIIPETFFDKPIGVYSRYPKGVLSQTHRRILEQSGTLTNIFVLSKALFFMYGCDEEIEKVVLGEFSLRQPDSEQFELLKKKIKGEVSQ